MNKILSFLSVIIFVIVVHPSALAQGRCATMDYLQMQLQQNPQLAAQMQAVEQQTQQYVAKPTNSANRSIITIPTVVHVVYANTAQNISTAQIQSQIDRLNLDYQKLNPDWTNTPSVWQSLVADYQIEFCLASRDPNGNTTTGIVRKSTTTSSFSTNDNVKHNNSGGDDAWPAASYLNIWVCNLGGSLLGYAQFPGGASATDGVVINYTAFGSTGTAQSPYNLGRTATHEIGHWLNLYHIWGDDNGSCSGSDNVNDTPNQGSEHYGCPTFPSVSCSNGPNGDMFMNYMDYTDDACMNMFTNGQYARSSALFASGGARSSLLSSLGCTPVTQTPVANFSANATTSCTGQIQFTDLSSGSPTTWLWNFGDGSTSAQQNPAHTYTANGTYSVSLTVTNAFGNNTKIQSGYIVINKPTAPTVTGGSRCGTGTVTLMATSGDTIKWYSSANASTPISTGNPFTTPSISTNTTYYAETTATGATYHVGRTDNTGGGGNLNSAWYLIFNVLQPCTLQSVYVYAQGAGNRTFELQNSSGTVIATTTVNVPNGGSRVALNFALSVGTGYKLGLPSGSNINLYRNNFSTNYFPFNDAGGYLSITGNTVPNNYYYYCYDWIISGPSCVSERVPVTATVHPAIHLTGPSVTNISCFGHANGSIGITAAAGTPSFTFVWSSGQSTSSISNLAAGNYTLTVTDAANCSASASAIITEPAVLSTSATATAVSCYGGNSGAVNITVSGGTPSYTYNWSNGTATQNLNGIAAGNYSVTITDAHSCSATLSQVVGEPAALLPQTTANDAACGANNGSASVSANGGTSPYTFSWNNGATTTSLNNLSAGSYIVTVTDNHNCTATASANVSNIGSIAAIGSSVAATCNGSTNGSASATVSSGTAPITYLWSNGAQVATINNLAAGTYTVTITDGNSCSAILSETVTEPTAISGNVSTTSAGCGSNTGTASITATGGASGYSYNWSSGATGNTITGLAAGTYSVTITDNNNCTGTASGIVSSSGNLSASITATDVTCYGLANGSGNVSVNNGTAPYSFAWSNGANTSMASGLTAGAYTVTITDNNNCQEVQTVTVTEPAELTVSINSTNPTCIDGNSGSAVATVSGGTAGFAYTWSSGATAASVSNLAAGNYSVTVDDANHCSTSASFVITAPSAVTITTTSGSTVCFGDHTGTAGAIASGGTPSYSYQWSNGVSGDQLSGVAAGTYSLTVADANQCSATVAVSITSPAPLQFATSTTNATTGQSNGSVSVSSITGGTAPYTYQWSNGETSNPATHLAVGTYSVTVTDHNGCEQSANVIVSEISGLDEVLSGLSFTVHPNPASNTIMISTDLPETELEMSLRNILGQTVLQQSIRSHKTDLDISQLSPGVYLIELKAGNARGIKQIVITR